MLVLLHVIFSTASLHLRVFRCWVISNI